jgi:hypothetical protein
LRSCNAWEYIEGEVALGHPPFTAGSKAARIEIDSPLRNIQDIEYRAEDDAVLERWLGENVNTT